MSFYDKSSIMWGYVQDCFGLLCSHLCTFCDILLSCRRRNENLILVSLPRGIIFESSHCIASASAS